MCLKTTAVEEAWLLVGRRRGRVWLARRASYASGEAASVRFDGPAALRRDERRGDVVGFLHTHPAGPLRPSRRDVRTMRAWCSALGKPLLCVIARGPGRANPVKAFRFDNDESAGVTLESVECFPRGVVVVVDGPDVVSQHPGALPGAERLRRRSVGLNES